MEYFLKIFSVFFVIICVGGAAVKLPPYFKKCDFNDDNLNDCIRKSAMDAYGTLSKGDKNLHFHNLLPLKVPVMLIGTAGLQINLTDITIYGLDDPKNFEINMDFLNKKLIMKSYFESCGIIGHYDINGRILVLPITGSGPANVTYAGGSYDLVMDFDIIEGKGNHYIKILDSDMKYELKRAYFKLENLFNGNRILADPVEALLDENWKEVNSEIGVQVGKALGRVFGEVLREFFARVPLEELFLNYSPL